LKTNIEDFFFFVSKCVFFPLYLSSCWNEEGRWDEASSVHFAPGGPLISYSSTISNSGTPFSVLACSDYFITRLFLPFVLAVNILFTYLRSFSDSELAVPCNGEFSSSIFMADFRRPLSFAFLIRAFG